MVNTPRKPLILILLGLPIKLIRIILYVTGSLSYLPIYAYCLIFRWFLFHPSFETNQTFYMLLSLPRAVLSLGGFAIGAGELYLIIKLIKQVAEFGSNMALIVTMISIIGFTLFSFRFGYKLLFNKLRFPQLKSVKEHLELSWFGIQDILSFIFTVLATLLIFRVKELYQYQPEPAKRGYFAHSFRMLVLSLYDLVCVVFWIIVFILHWRYGYTRRVSKHIKSEESKHLFVMSQAFNALFDLIFIPFMCLVMISPFLKGRRLLGHMNKLAVISWRRLIFDETMELVMDIPAILCFLTSLVTGYEIPLALKLYKKTLVDKVKPLKFEGDDLKSLGKITDHQEQAKLGIKVHDQIRANDQTYRSLFYYLLYIALIDVLTFVSFVVVKMSVYRGLILNKKIAALKEFLKKKETKNENTPLSFSEYRNTVHGLLLETTETENKMSLEKCLTYPYMVIGEMLIFLVDIPIIALSILLIVAPWRLYEVIKNLKVEWKKLSGESIEDQLINSPREYVLVSLAWMVVDYFVIILAVASTLGFWRWNYMISEIQYLLKSDLKTINKDKGRRFLSKFDAYDSFFFKVITCLFTDLLFLPIVVAFAPFYLVCFWRILSLVRCLKSTSSKDFAEHRSAIVMLGLYCIQDFLSFFAVIFVCLTVFRIKTLKVLTRLLNEKHSIVKASSVSRERENSASGSMSGNSKKQVNPKKKQDFSGEVIQREKVVPVLKAARKCMILLGLDIMSIPSVICCLLIPPYFKKYRIAVAKLVELNKEPKTAKMFVDVEKQIIQQRFKYGIKSLAMIITGILVLISFCLLLWRFPTLYQILKNKELRENLIKSIVKEETKQKKLLKDKFQATGVHVFFCFAQVVKDLPIIPVFLLLNLVTPWRSVAVYKRMYKYDLKTGLGVQISDQRKLVVSQFVKGLNDIYATFKLAVIVATLIRLPFLVLIILKNRFPNSNASKKLFKINLLQQQQQLDEGKSDEKEKENTRLSLLKCINISFKELCKDIPYLMMGLIMIVIAPWRVITIISIIASQVDRIPSQDMEAKKLKLFSRRYEIPYLFKEVLRVDAIQILKMICIVLTIHRIPKLFKILLTNFIKIIRKNKAAFTLLQEIDLEFKNSLNDFLKIFCSIIILIFIARIKNTRRRLKVYRSFIEGKQSAAKHKQHVVDEATGEDRLSFNDITWDTYGTICQFLNVEDLAKLSQVNRKFNNLNKKDFYWEYQYKRNWPDRKGIDENVTFQQKCARAFLEDQSYKQHEPLTEERRDRLYGTVYILFEEAVKSFKLIPHLVLVPLKAVMSIIAKKINLETPVGEYFPLKDEHFMDISRTLVLNRDLPLSNFYVSEFSPANPKSWHLGLGSTIFLVLLRYHCDMGHYLAKAGVFLVAKTSTGGINRYEIQLPNAEARWLRINNGFGAAPADYGIVKRTLFHFAQLLSCIVYIVFLLSTLVIFPYILCHFFGYGIIESISGTHLFLLLLQLTAIINAIVTMVEFMRRCAPFFEPWKAFSDIYYMNRYLGDQAWKHVGKPIFDKLSQGIKFGLKTIKKMLTVGYTSVKKVVMVIVKAVLTAGKGVVTTYTGLLTNATTLSLRFGLIGDLFLTIFAILWMIWPLALPIFYLEKIYFIPFGLLCIILMFVGYKIIQKASKRFVPS